MIKAEIVNRRFNTEDYPSKYDIEHHEKSLVPLLRLLTNEVTSCELEQSSIGQTRFCVDGTKHDIGQAIRTRFYIPPLLFGLGIELDHKFGSKWLKDELFKLGFCISSSEITPFKQSVMANNDSNVEVVLNDSFTQWAADNVYHNVCSLGGKDFFHGMGIITAGMISPMNEDNQQRIKRIRYGLKAAEIVSKAKIPISWYDVPDTGALTKMSFKPIVELQSPQTFSLFLDIDLFWQLSFMSSADENWSQWNEFMQLHQHGKSHPGKSQVFMAPIIDLNPSGENSIYTTLLLMQRQAT